ncbi:putative inner membrane protein [Fimbriiglobus ruber]|uniref:Putative inner membrane protein n=1 Tax=Fimbriiglobus ruber TaxID=1908690 RepID=A0A225DI93_9BACT|nr:putative inner membrane protein [Fimbriiglobus ruber]
MGGLATCRGSSIAQQPPQLTQRQQQLIASIHWQHGPCEAKLGSVATIKVPDGYQFTDGQGARAYQEMAAQPPNPKVLGMLLPSGDKDQWSVFFSYDDMGYVKDDEKDTIDADGILENIKAGTEESNKYRVSHGGSPMHVVGWEEKPSYSSQTHRLTWALRANDKDGDIINYNSRILGRGGVMSANLVVDPTELQTTLPTYLTLLEGFKFVPGQTHADWRQGDKVAEYGLSALVAGGALAVAAKTGLLGKLLKPLLIGGALLLGALAKAFRWITGRKPATEDGTNPNLESQSPPAPASVPEATSPSPDKPAPESPPTP